MRTLLAICAAFMFLAADARSQTVGPRPEGVTAVGVDEHKGRMLPLQTVFTAAMIWDKAGEKYLVI